MALQAAQHEAVHNKTGSDLDRLKAKFDEGVHSTLGEFTTTVSGKTTTYSLPITVVETDTSGKSPVTTTKTGSITLT
jgi:hypothetical protein